MTVLRAIFVVYVIGVFFSALRIWRKPGMDYILRAVYALFWPTYAQAVVLGYVVTFLQAARNKPMPYKTEVDDDGTVHVKKNPEASSVEDE